MARDYSEDKMKPGQIKSWSDEQLTSELRNQIRATLGPDAYHLLFAEALARLLEEKNKRNSGTIEKARTM